MRKLVFIVLVVFFVSCTGTSDPGFDLVDYTDLVPASIPSALNADDANPEGSVVDLNGQLSLNGSQMVNEAGNPVQLKGMSSFWINWSPGSRYANAEVVSYLANDWGIEVYRVAIGAEASDGYIQDPDTMISIAREVIDACIEEGIYVIVDWHSHDNLDNGLQEGEFMKGIAETYGEYPNIIYELWNEPIDQSWSREIKPYCENLIDNVIRPIDSDNIIVVGTSTWSQDVDDCASDPIDASNIMYTLHFYAGTHGSSLRSRADSAMNNGIALFVTEWGTTLSNGDDGVFIDKSNEWLNWMDENNISWANWSIADKEEDSAALLPGANTSGGWTDEEISPSGLFVKSQF